MQGSAETRSAHTAVWPRTIADVMTRHPVSIHPDASLATAHSIMRALGVHHLPVVDQCAVVGIVSQGDLRLLESLDRLDLTRVQVEEAMTQHPYVVGADEPLASALRAMLDRHIGAVLITECGRLVGIFTAFDAIAALRRLAAAHDE